MSMTTVNNQYTLSAIAGYCNELTLWELLRDILALLTEPLAVSADNIVMNCDTDESLSLLPDIPQCSEQETIWRIGAIISYLSSGRQPFGGRGIGFINLRQRAELPSLRREHASLNGLVHCCLAHDPDKRPSLSQLAKLTDDGLADAIKRASQRQPDANSSSTSFSHDHCAWPEEMKP